MIRLKLLSRVLAETNDIQTGYHVHSLNNNEENGDKEDFFKMAIKVSYKILTHEDTLRKSSRYIKIPIPFTDYCQVIFLSSSFLRTID